jgi:transposase
MVTVEKKEEIRRAYFVDKKSILQISEKFGCARKTVRKAIEDPGAPEYKRTAPLIYPVLEPFIPTINRWLKEDQDRPKKQRHTAHRVWIRLKEEHTFTGSESCVRRYVRSQRLVIPEVYIPLFYKPGQDSQTDWGEAKVLMNGQEIKVQFFAIRPCYSGACFVAAYPTQKQEAFFDGHQRGFEFLGGVTKRNLYDNLKTAVQKVLSGRDRKEQASFIAFRSHFLFESVFCQPAKANEKGGVENLVGYVQRNYFVPLPDVSSFDQLNEILYQRCLANLQRTITGRHKSIGQMLEDEHAHFLPLPKHPFDCCRIVPVKSDSCSRIQFETNKYSVPTEFAYQTLSCKAYPFQIRITRQEKVIAQYPRCYGRYQEIYNPLHYLNVLERKPGAFLQAKPLCDWKLPEAFGEFYAGLKQRIPQKATREYIRTLKLLGEFSLDEVTESVEKALSLQTYQTDAVRMFLIEKKTGITAVSRQWLNISGMFPQLARYQVTMANPVSYNQLLKEEDDL